MMSSSMFKVDQLTLQAALKRSSDSISGVANTSVPETHVTVILPHTALAYTALNTQGHLYNSVPKCEQSTLEQQRSRAAETIEDSLAKEIDDFKKTHLKGFVVKRGVDKSIRTNATINQSESFRTATNAGLLNQLNFFSLVKKRQSTFTYRVREMEELISKITQGIDKLQLILADSLLQLSCSLIAPVERIINDVRRRFLQEQADCLQAAQQGQDAHLEEKLEFHEFDDAYTLACEAWLEALKEVKIMAKHIRDRAMASGHAQTGIANFRKLKFCDEFTVLSAKEIPGKSRKVRCAASSNKEVLLLTDDNAIRRLPLKPLIKPNTSQVTSKAQIKLQLYNGNGTEVKACCSVSPGLLVTIHRERNEHVLSVIEMGKAQMVQRVGFAVEENDVEFLCLPANRHAISSTLTESVNASSLTEIAKNLRNRVFDEKNQQTNVIKLMVPLIKTAKLLLWTIPLTGDNIVCDLQPMKAKISDFAFERHCQVGVVKYENVRKLEVVNRKLQLMEYIAPQHNNTIFKRVALSRLKLCFAEDSTFKLIEVFDFSGRWLTAVSSDPAFWPPVKQMRSLRLIDDSLLRKASDWKRVHMILEGRMSIGSWMVVDRGPNLFIVYQLIGSEMVGIFDNVGDLRVIHLSKASPTKKLDLESKKIDEENSTKVLLNTTKIISAVTVLFREEQALVLENDYVNRAVSVSLCKVTNGSLYFIDVSNNCVKRIAMPALPTTKSKKMVPDISAVARVNENYKKIGESELPAPTCFHTLDPKIDKLNGCCIIFAEDREFVVMLSSANLLTAISVGNSKLVYTVRFTEAIRDYDGLLAYMLPITRVPDQTTPSIATTQLPAMQLNSKMPVRRSSDQIVIALNQTHIIYDLRILEQPFKVQLRRKHYLRSAAVIYFTFDEQSRNFGLCALGDDKQHHVAMLSSELKLLGCLRRPDKEVKNWSPVRCLLSGKWCLIHNKDTTKRKIYLYDVSSITKSETKATDKRKLTDLPMLAIEENVLVIWWILLNKRFWIREENSEDSEENGELTIAIYGIELADQSGPNGKIRSGLFVKTIGFTFKNSDIEPLLSSQNAEQVKLTKLSQR